MALPVQEVTRCARHAQTELYVTASQRALQGRMPVVMLFLQNAQPAHLLGATPQVRLSSLDHRRIKGGVSLAHGFHFAEILQLKARVVVYRLQHNESWHTFQTIFSPQQALVEERFQTRYHVECKCVPAYSLAGFDRTASLKH